MGLQPQYPQNFVGPIPVQNANQPSDPTDALLSRILSQRYDPTVAPEGGDSALTTKHLLEIAALKANQQAQQALQDEQNKVKQAEIGVMRQAYQMPVPQQEELQSQGQYPAFQAPGIPNRPAPRADRTSQILAGLAAGLAPGFMAGGLQAQPLEGALQHAEQVYQDRLQNYKLSYQQAIQQHEDAINARNEEAKRLAINVGVRYNNALGKYSNAFESLKNVDAVQAALDVIKNAGASAKQSEAQQAALAATQQGEEIATREKMSKEQSDLMAKFASPTERYYANLIRQQEKGAEFNRKQTETERHNLTTEDLRRAGVEGFIDDSGVFHPGRNEQSGINAGVMAGIRENRPITIAPGGIAINPKTGKTIATGIPKAPTAAAPEIVQLRAAEDRLTKAITQKNEFDRRFPLNVRMQDENLRRQMKGYLEAIVAAQIEVAAARSMAQSKSKQKSPAPVNGYSIRPVGP